MPRPVSIYAYFLPRIFLEALSGSEACMPVAPIQRSGLNCHCPLAGSILMALLHRKKCDILSASCSPVGWMERSDTHQRRCVWRWVSLRSTHPTKHAFAISRRIASEVCILVALLEKRGRREDRVLAAPAVSRAICANKNAHEHTGQREHSGLPCAMALRLIARSPR